MNPFKMFWLAGRDLFDELFLMIGLNLLWLIMVGPLFVIALLLLGQGMFVYAMPLALLNVLLLGPANAGLLQVAERITDGRVASFALFFEGMRQYRVLSWKLYGLWMLGFIACAANVWFYVQMNTTLGFFLTILFAYVMGIWCTLQMYLGPLMLLQQRQDLRLLWRNAAVLTFAKPLFTFVTAILMGGIFAISIWTGILALILLFSFLALWGMRSTKAMVAAAAERQISQEEKEAELPIGERIPKGQIRPRK